MEARAKRREYEARYRANTRRDRREYLREWRAKKKAAEKIPHTNDVLMGDFMEPDVREALIKRWLPPDIYEKVLLRRLKNAEASR